MTQSPRLARTATERLWARVPEGRPDECWLWPGFTEHGYGKIGNWPVDRAPVYVHRVSYEDRIGPIPDGLVIDHLCRVRSCVNPTHLEAVTQAENLRRATTSMSTLNAAKTHCPAGHEYTPDNTRIGATGTRFCRVCNRNQKVTRKAVPPWERREARGGRPRNGRWSLVAEACTECSTTERAHRAGGLCVNCYARDRRRTKAAAAPK